MDWLPAFLAAAGAAPISDPTFRRTVSIYQSLPVSAENVAPIERKVFWATIGALPGAVADAAPHLARRLRESVIWVL